MGEHFKSTEDFYRVAGAFLTKAALDRTVAAAVQKTNLTVRVEVTDPAGSVHFHIGDPAGLAEGKCLTFHLGDGDKHAADAVLEEPSDFFHRFWLGMENLGAAVVNGQIRARGNYLRALALLPAIKPFFRTYRETLADLGLENLIPAEKK